MAATAMRAGVTLAILGYLFSKIDMARWGGALYDSASGWLLAAIAANAVMVFVSTYKWDRLLRGLDIRLRAVDLLRLYLIGFFASSCLPGIVGGDAVRWHLTAKLAGGQRLEIGATILAERALGVVALIILCVVVIALNWQWLATAPILTLCCGMTLALLCGMTVVLSRRLNVVLRYRARRSLFRRPTQLAYRLHKALRMLPRRSILIALACSWVFYIAGALAVYFISISFSVRISLSAVIAIQAIVCLLLLIPISLGGLGLGQAADVYLFGIFGVTPYIALGISVAGLLIKYVYVLIGGFLFVQWRGPNTADSVPSAESLNLASTCGNAAEAAGRSL